MATLNLQCGESADDARETYGGDVFITSFTLSIGDFGAYGQCGWRFPGVSGLSGSTITSAIVTFRADATDSDSFTGTVYAHKADAPGVFVLGFGTYSISDTGQRPRTAGLSCGSAELGNWTLGSDYTFDVQDIVQELADDQNPSAIVLMYIYGSGSGERMIESYDHQSALAAKLDITYTVSAGDDSIVAVLPTAEAAGLEPAFVASSTVIAPAAIDAAHAYAEGPAAEILSTASGTIAAALSTAEASVYITTWVADALLEPPLATAYAESLAGSLLAAGVTWVAFDWTQFQLTREDFPTGTTFYLEATLITSSADNVAKLRIYNVTDTAKVVGAEVTSVATSVEPALSGAFDFPPGTKTYRVEGGGSSGGNYDWGIVKVLVDW